jgi:hypothetical protein
VRVRTSAVPAPELRVALVLALRLAELRRVLEVRARGRGNRLPGWRHVVNLAREVRVREPVMVRPVDADDADSTHVILEREPRAVE